MIYKDQEVKIWSKNKGKQKKQLAVGTYAQQESEKCDFRSSR